MHSDYIFEYFKESLQFSRKNTAALAIATPLHV